MRLKVYYLDDEKYLCENFEDYFNSTGVGVTTFTEAKVAIETIKTNPPDLIFIDYRLPDMNGDEVAQALDPKIPKYLITGDLKVKTDYPFVKIISKPYTESAIGEIISQYASIKSSRS